MKPYEPYDFCKFIGCALISYGTKCTDCKAKRMHDYLSDNGQILEEGSELAKVVVEVEQYKPIISLLLEKKRICKEYPDTVDSRMFPTTSFINSVYEIKDIDRQIDELLAGLEG